MKYLTAFLFFLLFSLGIHGQNLVPNYSFEDTLACPTQDGEINDAPPWVDPTNASTDYYQECSSNSFCSAPGNAYGFQFPRTGKAYAGLATYENAVPNLREFLQVKLTDSLRRGQTYCVTFYVAWAGNCQYASNGLGAYFSANPVSCFQCLLPYTPQINYLGPVIRDTGKWVPISGTIVAQGGERYLTIGNLNADGSTLTTFVNPTGIFVIALYYIDDVYVGSCDTTKPLIIKSSLLAPNVFTPNNDGQNDVFKIQGTNLQGLNCKIYDRWGGKVWELKNPDESWDGHNQTGMPCNDGVYFYVLDTTGVDGVAYHNTGFVELIR
jgi:gliding motility-associated-like protein